MSGSAVNEKTFNSFQAKLKPKSRGKVKFETFVDGNLVKGLFMRLKLEKSHHLNWSSRGWAREQTICCSRLLLR